jgi:alkaline phosphatase
MLSKDGDGFVFVIEEALIDKASHNMQMEYVASEMHALSETLAVIFDFYEEHPYETLIILTADHETGAFTTDEDFSDVISALPDIDCSREPDELTEFLEAEWNIVVSEKKIREKRDFALSRLWDSDEKNYTLLHSYIASAFCEVNGIEITSKYHSRQEVPLYTLGLKSDLFAECESICDIAPAICEIMGWEALPEACD